ncbi:hypothetical protein FO440_14830 [Mucilaginibacter corticis]|uniref:Uncharacterized protein n=1 Tax=Mucilaginibacter corticis TaxID=2597670 RepID=A0A556MM55_9SPHI|nr:hypothetical protein [Mucilaginibacter corticis]TSJ41006.1 hypothetical protein FO440_14830 [Mucilaginibacter corticis]
MRKFILPLLALPLCLSLSGCGLMEDAFKAGFIFALIIAAIIGLLIWIFHFSWKLLTKNFPALRIHYEGFWDE